VDVRLKTQTPLWTGSVEPGTANSIKVDRIHETSILGSLRWWYELLVRGVGGCVCDPTTHACLYDPKKPNDGLCDVCRVFGATGWKRRVRLTVLDQTRPDKSSPKQISASRPRNPRTQKIPTWQFPDHPRSGDLTIRIQSLDEGYPAEILGGLVQFAADWTAIGARSQMGFGVVETLNGKIDTQPLYKKVVAAAGTRRYSDLPTLQNLFLARIQLKKATDRDTFNLKYDLRRLFKDDEDLRHFVMGTIKGGRMAAKIHMSRPYDDGLMRVWGWIPEQASVYQGKWNRDTVVDAIFQHLRTNYALQVWREMNPTRDPTTPKTSDVKAFLQNLLGIEEEDDAV
jgi:CRISPR-associated protein Cmr1